MENLSEEDVERIAKKMLELKKENRYYGIEKQCICEVKNKYHWKLYHKFGETGCLENSIRVTACLLAGYRRVADVPLSKAQEVSEYLEELYKRILGEE